MNAKADKDLLSAGVQALKRLSVRIRKNRPLKEGERAALALLTGAEDQGDGFRVFDSIASCASATKTPKATLQRLKKEGCPAFKGSRVYESLLLPWLRAREEVAAVLGEPEDKSVLECRFLRLKCEREQIKRDRDLETLVPYAEVDEFITAVSAKVKSILHDRLRKELPPKLVGLDSEDIAARMLDVETDVMKQIQWAGVAQYEVDEQEEEPPKPAKPRRQPRRKRRE